MLFVIIMVRTFIFGFLFLWGSIYLYSNDTQKFSDKVLMKIGEEKIYLSEFNFFYENVVRYKDCSKEDYFYSFLKYKLKISDAKRLRLDKNIDYAIFPRDIKDDLSYLNDSESNTGEYATYILTYRIYQDENTDCGLNVMRNVYSKLESGVKLDELSRDVNEPRISCERIFNEDYLLKEMKKELSKVQQTGYSQPFISPEGVHIIVKSASNNLKYKLEYCVDDAFLVSEWDKFCSDNILKYSDEDLERFFKANRKKYKWELPHFKGAVVHCKDKKAAKKIRKKIKKLPIEKWKETLENIMSQDSDYCAVIDVGLFQIGENEYVDNMVFKCGNYKDLDEYPYTFAIGKCLDYMPDSYKDVYDVIVQDYIVECENKYFENLERELRVEKYIDVLKTVNSDGSN